MFLGSPELLARCERLLVSSALQHHGLGKFGSCFCAFLGSFELLAMCTRLFVCYRTDDMPAFLFVLLSILEWTCNLVLLSIMEWTCNLVLWSIMEM